jgi:lipoprotein-anchoring transpeptidase ErfK/SrfK
MALLVLALAGAGYFFWQKRHGRPLVPRWAGSLAEAFRDEPATNAPPAPRPRPAPSTNLLALPPATNQPATTNPPPPRQTESPALAPKPEPRLVRQVRDTLDAQIALARMGISVGPIDGASGNNMRRALLAWQIHSGLSVSGELDAESRAVLTVEEPLFQFHTVTEQDLKRLMKVPATWLGKSEAERLDYESILELAAEKGRSSVGFVRKLNPSIDWTNVTVGAQIKIPRIGPPPAREKAAFVRVHLYSKTLDVFGQRTNLLAHFPCSIAAKVEKRPVGRLHVAKAAANPNYLFDPEVFGESAEARKIGRKLVIPPGPNNPVGTAWIGLDKPGYGIHGTPKPEQVGRTESHGCFRLANWNAEHLLQLAWVGMPVIVEP